MPALLDVAGPYAYPLSLIIGSFLVLTSVFLYLFRQPSLPKNAPQLSASSLPILGSLDFFYRRWDSYKEQVARSPTGNFSFFVGTKPVIALTGPEQRKLFFEHRSLSLTEAYMALQGGSPPVKENNNILAADHGGDTAFSAYFSKRILAMLKGPQLKAGMPQMLRDARANLDAVVANPSGITDPFESIYRMVFHFTMRTVACHDIADDPALLSRVLKHFETIEAAATPVSIIYPWLPTPNKLKRNLAGAQLYMIFSKIISGRKKSDRRADDALQYLIDQGDKLADIILFVLGALFAGQLNTGINAAWILCYLANNQYWLERVRAEVTSVADKYSHDKSFPLKDRLMDVPAEAWESEFPLCDLCLRDSIRLQLSGTAMRQNRTGKDIPINKHGEVIPNGAYVTFATGDNHYNEDIWTKPDEWDPGRYLPDRAEDKKQQYAFTGWGVSRHPCLGKRFAQLECTVIVAMFLAYFDEFNLTDVRGEVLEDVPQCNRNNLTSKKPDQKIYLTYKVKQEGTV